jgi:hypothetical protein
LFSFVGFHYHLLENDAAQRYIILQTVQSWMRQLMVKKIAVFGIVA